MRSGAVIVIILLVLALWLLLQYEYKLLQQRSVCLVLGGAF